MRIPRRVFTAASVFAALVSACSTAGMADSNPTTPPPSSTAAVDPTTGSVPSTTLAPPTPPAPTVFTSTVTAVSADMVPASWRAGCPVALGDLRLLRIGYWGFDDQPHIGELVVDRKYADAIVRVFASLYAQRFPIERMELVDRYGGDDEASMRANNTSAFNCREVSGRPGVLSQHAFGAAIDINPLVNPWVRVGQIDPPEGAPYADRSRAWKGGIYPDDAVVRAFASIGWVWGGTWSDGKDYQHFSSTGT